MNNKRLIIIVVAIVAFALVSIFARGPLLVPNVQQEGMLTSLLQTHTANTYLELASVNQKFYNEMQVEGPYTLFIPNDQVLAQLPKEEIATLLKTDADSSWDRTNFLAAHMVIGDYPLNKLQDGMTLKTVQGKMITFHKKGTNWYIDNTIRIDNTDIASKNGIVHTIDGVITPNPY